MSALKSCTIQTCRHETVSDDGILQREGQLCSAVPCVWLSARIVSHSLSARPTNTTGTTPRTHFRSFQCQCSRPHLSSLSPARCSAHFSDSYQPPVWMGVREEVSRFYPVRCSASSLVRGWPGAPQCHRVFWFRSCCGAWEQAEVSAQGLLLGWHLLVGLA